MNHFKSSLSTVGAVAVLLGTVACGESQQQPAQAPVGTTTDYAQQAQQAPPAPSPDPTGQYGSAMGQPQEAAPAPPSMGGASGQLNPQYGQPGQMGQMGQPSEQSPPPQYGQQYGTPPPSQGQTGGGQAGAPSTMGGMGGAMDVSSLNDAQLAAVIQAIHQDQMQEAQLAEQRATSPELKRYARDMVNSHRNIMNENQSVLSQAQITPSDNAVSQQLRTDAQNEMSTLEGLRGRDFDREYLDDQIRNHNKAIELVDRIVPNIKNPQLKAHLQSVRTRLEGHLREAERIQQKMQQGSTNKQPSDQNQHRNQNPNQNQNPGGTQNPY
jgi:putative membrane protein